MQTKTAVIAIGGNALIRDSSHLSVEDQEQTLRDVCPVIADMLADGWDLVIVHGNGPQVGFIARRSAIAHRVEGMHEVPLDVCTADTQGAIGYELQQSLQNELYHRRVSKNVATVITQVLVDSDDQAFSSPSKPVGGFLTKAEATQRETDYGWATMEDAGRGWRRVVPSPAPKEIVEIDTIKGLLNNGIVVIAAGGGGIPVVDTGQGEYRGVAAVIDKDLAASLLSIQIEAGLLLIATSVDYVSLNYGTDNEQRIHEASLDELKAFLTDGSHFGKGSMEPKIAAVVQFLENGGGNAIITSPDCVGAALNGDAGTRFYR
jgi:carbamate kinase